MDIELYRTFLAISETRSFTDAARQAGRTQAAVSQQVKRLETTLGRPLFERSGGTVELTEFGKALLGYARSIVDTHSQALAAFSRGSFEGIVVIGIPDAYLNRLHAAVVREFVRLYPEARLNVVVDASPQLAGRIVDGSIDLAFVTRELAPTRGPKVFSDRLVVVGPDSVDLSKADPLPLTVWDARNANEDLLIRTLERLNRRYRVAHICRSVLAQHDVIVAGLCMAPLAESAIIPGERAYLDADGFPVLKQMDVHLERSRAKKSRIVDRLEQHFLSCFSI